MLKKIIEIKMYKLTKDWGNLQSEKHHDFCSSSDIIRVRKLKKMTFSWNVTRMERKLVLIRFWRESKKERSH